MNIATIVCLVIAIALEHISGLIVMRQGKGSPLTRAMLILAWPLFTLALGFSDYLPSLTAWLRVPIAIVLGYVLWAIWTNLPLSGALNWLEHRIIWGQTPSDGR